MNNMKCIDSEYVRDEAKKNAIGCEVKAYKIDQWY